MAQRVTGITAAAEKVEGAAVKVVACSDETFPSVEEAITNDIKLNGPPDAYLASNEAIALATLGVVEAMGYVVPAEIKITGFNAFNLWLYAKTKITTISYPAIEVRERAGQIMMDRLAGGSFLDTVTIFEGVFTQGDTTLGED